MITVGMSWPYPILCGGAPVGHLATITCSNVQVSVIPGRWGSEVYICNRRLLVGIMLFFIISGSVHQEIAEKVAICLGTNSIHLP